MAKRRLDTGFTRQSWIRKLKPKYKAFLIYYFCECDNAGIIDADEIESAEFWIGEKIGDPASFLPEGYIVSIDDGKKYFMPRFIEYQYGDLKSEINIVKQARQILSKYGLIDKNNCIKFTQMLGKNYPTSNTNTNTNTNIGESEGKKSKGKTLFKNSGVTLSDIAEAFAKTDDLARADALYYYNALKDASESKGYTYVNWIATARAWARRDLKEGKLKVSNARAGKKQSSNVPRILEEDYSRYKGARTISQIREDEKNGKK